MSARFSTGRLKIIPAKKTKKDGERSAVALLKDARQLLCVFKDIEPPECSSTLRKSTKVLGPTRRVQFSKATLRHANIRESKGPSLGVIQIKHPQEEAERKERCARGDVWRLGQKYPKGQRKGHNYISPAEVWCLPAPSVIKPEEWEFVVNFGAPMHMLSRKDLNSAELETVRVSESPMTVVTASGEMQTNDEATVYVKGLSSLTRKTLRRPRVFLRVDQVSETTTHKNGRRIQCSTENYVPIVVPGLSTGSSSSATHTSPASLPQDPVVSTLRPETTRSERSSSQARWDLSPEQTETEKNKQKGGHRASAERPVAWSARMVGRTHTKSCGRKSSRTQGRTREFFSWVSFRAAEKSGIG